MAKKQQIKITQVTPKQEEIIKDILKQEKKGLRTFVIKSPRQCGKSVLLQKLLVAFALRKSNQVAGFFSVEEYQVKKFFDEVKNDYGRLLNKRETKNLILVFKNGTVIFGNSAKSKSRGIGDTYDFLMCDEHALWMKERWDRVAPSASVKNATTIVASTPRGKYNPFYILYKEGKQPKNPKVVRVKSYDMTKLDCIYPKDYPDISKRGKSFYTKEQQEEAKATMSALLYQQEIMGSFLDTLDSVFPYFERQQKIKEWEEYTPERSYFFGIDYSGRGEDKTVITIINDLGKVAYIHEVQAKDPAAQRKEVAEVLLKYHCVYGYAEENSIGAIYNSELDEMLEQNDITLERFQTSNESKAELVKITNKYLYKGEIEIPNDDLCYMLNYELGIYLAEMTPSNKIRYTHPVGQHDDYVDSLMFAIYAWAEWTERE